MSISSGRQRKDEYILAQAHMSGLTVVIISCAEYDTCAYRGAMHVICVSEVKGQGRYVHLLFFVLAASVSADS